MKDTIFQAIYLVALLFTLGFSFWNSFEPPAKKPVPRLSEKLTGAFTATDEKQIIEISNSVIELDRKVPEAYFNRAQASCRLKNYKAAVNDFEKAATLYRERNNKIGESLAKQYAEAALEEQQTNKLQAKLT